MGILNQVCEWGFCMRVLYGVFVWGFCRGFCMYEFFAWGFWLAVWLRLSWGFLSRRPSVSAHPHCRCTLGPPRGVTVICCLLLFYVWFPKTAVSSMSGVLAHNAVTRQPPWASFVRVLPILLWARGQGHGLFHPVSQLTTTATYTQVEVLCVQVGLCVHGTPGGVGYFGYLFLLSSLHCWYLPGPSFQVPSRFPP